MKLPKSTMSLGVVSLLIFAPVALAGEHAHSGHAPAVSVAPANPAQPWATDAPLRQAMASIRTRMEADLPRLQEKHFTETEYRDLALFLGKQVDFMVENCKLPPDADAGLHGVLEKILQGIGALEAGRSEAAVILVQALESYGHLFAHPGWKPPLAKGSNGP
ncbi:MAG: hypothetical protein HQL56_13650 [Magnetococcales bacterium]|nr:hypothetical protein [Magnetococcales bacterium]